MDHVLLKFLLTALIVMPKIGRSLSIQPTQKNVTESNSTQEDGGRYFYGGIYPQQPANSPCFYAPCVGVPFPYTYPQAMYTPSNNPEMNPQSANPWKDHAPSQSSAGPISHNVVPSKPTSNEVSLNFNNIGNAKIKNVEKNRDTVNFDDTLSIQSKNKFTSLKDFGNIVSKKNQQNMENQQTLNSNNVDESIRNVFTDNSQTDTNEHSDAEITGSNNNNKYIFKKKKIYFMGTEATKPPIISTTSPPILTTESTHITTSEKPFPHTPTTTESVPISEEETTKYDY